MIFSFDRQSNTATLWRMQGPGMTCAYCCAMEMGPLTEEIVKVDGIAVGFVRCGPEPPFAANIAMSFACNTQMAPFDTPRTRRAHNMAMNKQPIIAAVVQGAGVAARNPIRRTM